jgi:predicted ATPase with chaperone activity
MAVRRMQLSSRAHGRILEVACTIADLDHSDCVTAKDLAEAVQYRSLDRNTGSEPERFRSRGRQFSVGFGSM